MLIHANIFLEGLKYLIIFSYLKITLIFIDPNRSWIIPLYFYYHLNKPFVFLLNFPHISLHLHVKSIWKVVKIIANKRIVVKTQTLYEKNGRIYPYYCDSIKVFPINGFTNVTGFCLEVVNLCIFCC